ncbi:MAG: hypothetical protein LCH73_06845 [Proteobacteria bacterium]|nr:hypothetical protein [Pseudomonadota bacterium]
MRLASAKANPFGMLMDPQAVIAAMERSTKLASLNRRVCHPLDKPLIPKSAKGAAGAATYDAEIDAEAEVEAEPDAADQPLT